MVPSVGPPPSVAAAEGRGATLGTRHLFDKAQAKP